MKREKLSCKNGFKCVICKEHSVGFGNNPQPLKKGKCCDKCNFEKVVPARIKQITDAINN